MRIKRIENSEYIFTIDVDIPSMNPQLFDWDHASRNTDETVPGLRLREDNTIYLECWHGLKPKGYTRDKIICGKTEFPSIAIALEHSNGDWFWMHCSDETIENKPDDVNIPTKLNIPKFRG